MSTFSTTVTKAQRNTCDFDSRGREISICSRQHTGRPGYNPSPYEPQKLKSKPSITNSPSITGLVNTILEEGKNKALAIVQVRPNTKRGQRQNKPEYKDMKLPSMPIEKFLAATCELKEPLAIFIGIHLATNGQPCIGCAYDAHSKTGCSAKQQLLREIGFIK